MVLWALLTLLAAFGLGVALLVVGPNRSFRGTAVARAHAAVDRVLGAVLGRRNPVFQIVAVALYWAGLAIFAVCAAPHIPNRHVGSWHWVPICVTLATNMGLYAAASAADPGAVTAANAAEACATFPYDQLLFFERDCATCRLPKPARSKHCAVCGRCIQMAEHHCIWLNNCVGLRNARWFLGFLATFAVVCIYGAYLTATVVLELRHALGLAGPAARVWDDALGRPVALSFRSSLLVVLDDRPLLAVLLVLLAVLAPAILFFAGYQLRIAMLGYTGNEETKWLNVADAIEDGVVFAVRVADDPPREVFRVIEEEDQPGDPRPRRPISHLRQVPNIYDRGAWQNLAFILRPPPAPPGKAGHTD